MIAIIDYGVGNLFSLKSSLKFIDQDAVVTADKDVILSADKVILPGVGAFGDAADKLRENGLDQVVKEVAAKGTPLLGICVGMQLLFESSLEYGFHEGLGLIKGQVRGIDEVIDEGLDVPHMGWNRLTIKESPLFKDLNDGVHMYFVHSFAGFDCAEDTIATTEYGATLTAAVNKDNVYGTQFHPEKSGEMGLKLLKNFCEFC